NNILEIQAHHYTFRSNRFFLESNTVLSDIGDLDERKGVFVIAKDIECNPNSVLDITSRIIFNTETKKDDKTDTQGVGKVVTGKVLGYPILQIQTNGEHQVTNQLQVSNLIYPNKLGFLSLEGDLAKVEVKEPANQFKAANSKANQSQSDSTSISISPLKIEANLIKIGSAGLLNSDRPLLLFADELEMVKGSQIRSKNWIKVESIIYNCIK
ncbi:hypothetical protein MEO41_27130, partial [Dolichospermum sp. ST_sed4]|nr:hypothetical protein [Dolichospermum sp. ST_sed4]